MGSGWLSLYAYSGDEQWVAITVCILWWWWYRSCIAKKRILLAFLFIIERTDSQNQIISVILKKAVSRTVLFGCSWVSRYKSFSPLRQLGYRGILQVNIDDDCYRWLSKNFWISGQPLGHSEFTWQWPLSGMPVSRCIGCIDYPWSLRYCRCHPLALFSDAVSCRLWPIMALILFTSDTANI